jgi:hypothetical protein
MLHVVVRCVLAAVLVAAAAAKLARPRESRDALRGLLLLPGPAQPATWRPFAGQPVAGAAPAPRAPRDVVGWSVLAAVTAVELALAAGVAAGFDAAAFAASVFLMASAAVLGRALAAGRAGTPCGCFGARSKVGPLAVLRALALAAAFLALPFVPRVDPSAEAWLAAGLGVALVAIAGLVVAVLALAREVGMLRLAIGPQSALEVPDEGPPVGADTGLASHLDPRSDATVLGLAVFTSEGCHLCRQLEPAIRSLGRDPHVDLLVFDEVDDAEIWDRLDVPGSPYAVALDSRGRVLAKGTFNSLPQLESVLATGERRRRERSGV